MEIKKNTIPHQYRNKYLRNGSSASALIISKGSSVQDDSSQTGIRGTQDLTGVITLPSFGNAEIKVEGRLSVDENGYLRFS